MLIRVSNDLHPSSLVSKLSNLAVSMKVLVSSIRMLRLLHACIVRDVDSCPTTHITHAGVHMMSRVSSRP